jgi:hypothetical protein
MQKWLFGLMAMALMAMPVLAQDEPTTNVNPSGVVTSSSRILPPRPLDPGEILCGDLDYDRVNGLAAQRRPDGLQSWVMVYCEFDRPVQIQAFEWVTVDNTDNDWGGTDDFAIWPAQTVENGCADDSNTIAGGRDIRNTRVPLGEVIFGRNSWHYSMDIPDVDLPAGGYYFAVRAVVVSGQSYILTVPCNGRKPIYFQSVFFGFPCAVPGRNVFGVDYCAGVTVIGKDQEGGNSCKYNRKVKAKGGCQACPTNLGCEVDSGIDCGSLEDCRKKVKENIPCPEGRGKCKITHKRCACD